MVAEGRFYPCFVEEGDGWHARWRAFGAPAELNVDGWVDIFVREAAVTRLTEDAEDQRHETLHDAWLMALRSHTGLVRWDAAECRAFAAELEAWSGAAAEDVAARKGILFRLDGETLSCAVPKGRAALKALGLATYVCGALRGLRKTEGRLALTLTRVEAEAFVRTEAHELETAGYRVEGLPERADVTAVVELAEKTNEPTSLTRPAGDFKLTVRVAGQPVTADEIRFLLDQNSSLVFFREHWIEVDRNILKEALRALERGVSRKANLLAFAMGIGALGALEVEELKAHGWVRGLVNELRARGGMPAAPMIVGFHGALRAYQAKGVAWLDFMTSHGFGALLADDMGLGKTIQTIAWLLVDRARTPAAARRPTLIVAPLTLLANWRHEFETFAPALSIYIHQGERRHLASGFRDAALACDVVLTSYQVLVKDYSLFAETPWAAMVLDEAQIAKNPATQVAHAIRALTPRKRIALTGTPLENSLMDLWALEDFLNPGFLGDEKSFRQRFAKPLAYNPQAAAGAKLRHAIEPFVLRRLKSDDGIAAELGEKREIREYCELEPVARRQYEAALAAFRATVHTPGDAFALLTELKLICDGDGKFERLCDLLTQIFAAGESALVFTQYAKVGAELQRKLAGRFGAKFPFLHGTLSPTARENEIRKFNHGAPAFILSLKAGGFGLNLTKATHVIHFDRWWNPAVENQATDRAHRIGQAKTVFVHLLLTQGTVEEHVDEILRRKTTLRELIGDGAAFWKAVSLGGAKARRGRT